MHRELKLRQWYGYTLETYIKTNMLNFNFSGMKGGEN